MEPCILLSALPGLLCAMYNGTEEVINLGKTNVKKRRLESIIHGEQVNLNKMIEDSFKEVRP